jgi:hypothetical protein
VTVASKPLISNGLTRQPIFLIPILAGGALAALAQTRPNYSSSYSITTPKPISLALAEGTTNPSAQATQHQNPYLGSVPEKSRETTIRLFLQDAIARGLRYNLGLVESEHASSEVRAERLRALLALLPQLSPTATRAFEGISYREIGLKLPPIPGVPGTSADQRRVRISGCAGRLVAAVGRPGTTSAISLFITLM